MGQVTIHCETSFLDCRSAKTRGAEGRNQHVAPHGEGWVVVGEGNKRPTGVVAARHEGSDVATSIASVWTTGARLHGPARLPRRL